MKRSALVACCVAGLVVATSFWLGRPVSGDSSASQNGLPGARAEIDASRFPTLQAALDSVPEEGGIVRLPAGTFEINGPLVLSHGEVLLTGAGAATHIKNTNTQGHPALIVKHPDGANVRRADRLWRVQLENFRLTGNEQSGHGILAIQIEEIFINGVTVTHHGGDGIRLDNCYEDPRVSNSLMTYNKGTGLNLLGCHDIVASANQFEENQDALSCTDSFNLCMTGNCLDDHLGHGVIIENTYGSVVSGNMIEECQGTAIILDRDCYGITLSSNVIAHNGAGIDLRDAHGSTVTGNTFTLLKTDALRIGPGSGRIAVTGNNFSNSYLGEGKVRRGAGDLAAAGIVLEGTSDIALAGNVFASVRPQAIELKGDASRRVAFTGNVLTDVDSQHERLVDSIAGENLGPDSATGPERP